LDIWGLQRVRGGPYIRINKQKKKKKKKEPCRAYIRRQQQATQRLNNIILFNVLRVHHYSLASIGLVLILKAMGRNSWSVCMVPCPWHSRWSFHAYNTENEI